MKLNLKKINYHKWIPSRFSSFQAKLLIAFLVATLLPLTLVALVSYHVSYNLARDRITNSALMSDEQLIFQLNSCAPRSSVQVRRANWSGLQNRYETVSFAEKRKPALISWWVMSG